MTLNIGDKAVDYNLKNANEEIGGESLSLEQSAGDNGLVIVFECNHCPYVVASVDRMNKMAEYCKSKQIGFVGINSNDASVYANDSFEHMVKRAKTVCRIPIFTMKLKKLLMHTEPKEPPNFSYLTVKKLSYIVAEWMIHLGTRLKYQLVN